MAIRIYNLKDTEVEKSDIIIETFNVGSSWTSNRVGIRITHIPTGTVVECDTERSTHRNKFLAMEVLNNVLLNKKFQSGDEND